MRRSTRVGLALAAVLTAACNEAKQPMSALGPGSLQDQNTGLAAVSLSVTMASVDSLGNPYGITGDGQGAYVNGSQYVLAQIDKYGNFGFNTINGKRVTGIRWVSFNFNNPVDPSNTYRPSPSNANPYTFVTEGSAYIPHIPLQNLGVNGNPSTECVAMGGGMSNSSTTWVYSFHRGAEDTQTTPTAFAVFTRVSVSPAVWTATAVGSCSPNSNIAALRNYSTGQLYGYYYLPFFFTLTAQ
jgi:hypothetical protein